MTRHREPAPPHRSSASACCAGRTRPCSPARPGSPTTSTIPGALHLAVVRSPYAHARIVSIDTSAAAAMPGVVAVYTGADLADAWAAPMPCAWPVTDDMKNPAHYPLATARSCYVGDGVAAVLATSDDGGARRRRGGRGRVRAARRRDRPRGRAVRPRRHPRRRSARTSRYTWALKVEGTEGAVDEAFARRRVHSVSERYVQQRLLPMAMEPRAVAAVPQPFGGDITLYSATQIPHILKIMTAITLGIPEHQVRVVAPAVGGGFGSKLNVYAEELLCMALARKHGVPGALERDALARTRMATIHGRGQIQHIELAADADGKLTGDPGPAARRHGRLPPARHAGHPAARRVPLRRRLRPAGGLRLRVHVGVHDDDADRRLPRRRSPRGHVRHRAGDGRARRARSASIRWSCAGATSSRPRRSRTPRGAAWSTTRATTTRPPTQGRRARRLRRAARPSRRSRTSTAPRSASASACRRTSRCAAWRPSRVLASLNYSAGGWEAATVRVLPTAKVQVVTGTAPARPGPRDGVVDDRRRPARHQPRRRRRAAQRHGDRPARPRHLRVALAAGRRRRHRHGVRQGDRQGQARSPPTSWRRTPTTSSTPAARSASQGSPDKSMPLAAIAFEAFTAPQPARRPGAEPRGARHLRPAELLVAVRHAHLRRRGRHRDRRASTC